MKKAEIHDAAKAFVIKHADYISDWESRWESVVTPMPETEVTVGIVHPAWDKLTPEAIVDFFNAFWMTLPDSPSIHADGFYALCDIAEHVFGFDDDDEPQPTES